jgi:hypothetical protein
VRAEVADDLAKSLDTFTGLVWPAIKDLCVWGKDEYVSVESVTATGVAKDLDILAGIDGWQICRGKGFMRGIAARVQPDGKSWDSFTIRFHRNSGAETEYAKRSRAISQPDQGWLYPAITVQAYTSADSQRLISAGVVKTRDLYGYVASNLDFALSWPVRKRNKVLYRQETGNAMFLVVPWEGLLSVKVDLRVFRSVPVSPCALPVQMNLGY